MPCIVWDRKDYIKDAENQLGEKNIYEKIPDNVGPLMDIRLLKLWKIFVKERMFVLIL